MLLYKLRAFNSLDKLLDILLMERLYCAKYQDLNDPFEAMFHIQLPKPQPFMCGLSRAGDPLVKMKTTTTVAKHFPSLPEQRVCSLSRDISDVRLWSFYAAGHTGVAIEIDFSDIEEKVNIVQYRPELPKFSNTLLSSPRIEDILTHKTAHWVYEDEYRILHADEYFPIKGMIKRVIAGPLASESNLEILRRALPQLQIIKAKLNPETVEVEY